MTREEASTELKKHISPYTNCKADADANDATEMAIKALEQQACEDCISRQAVIKLLSYDWANRPAHKAVESIRNLPSVTPKEQPCEDAVSRGAVKAYAYHRTMYPNFEDYVDKLPPVTPKEKTGKWIYKQGIFGAAYCSKCDFELKTNNTKYCPNCGTRMVIE